MNPNLLLIGLFFAFFDTIKSETFIIGGTTAAKGAYPFMVGVYRDNRFICGGSLINSNHVLTAKHCTTSRGTLTVRLGDHDRYRYDFGQRTVGVEKIIRHGSVDIALLRLKNAVKTSRVIKTVSLATSEPRERATATAIGWGWTRHQDRNSVARTLQQLNLPVQSDTACTNDGLPIQRSTQLCAGFTTGSYVNVCHGDSGSPLLYRASSRHSWTQIGIVQGGHGGCSSRHHMALFVSVPALRRWIVDNSKGKSGGGGKCFSGDSLVATRTGELQMRDLRLGDDVLTLSPSGEPMYTKVISWLDLKADELTDYLQLDTEDGKSIKLTEKHQIYVADKRNMKRVVNAENVRVGDKLLINRDDVLRESNVTGIHTHVQRGAYAPLTESGHLLVNNVLVSCYAHTSVHPSFAHAAFAPMRVATSLYSAAANLLSL